MKLNLFIKIGEFMINKFLDDFYSEIGKEFKNENYSKSLKTLIEENSFKKAKIEKLIKTAFKEDD